jgi:peptidoglycan/LPS O-acetylase OafA/YrhL
MEQISSTLSQSEDNQEKNGKNFFQIDILKAIMICFVIFDHAVHSTLRFRWGAELWERMAIPVFLIIMGFNMGKSFKRKGNASLKELYSRSYFKSKFWRYIFPFLIFYTISTIIGFVIYGPTFLDQFQIMDNVFLGLSPFLGPGNWFIPVLFGSILIMPLLYYCFNKKPKLTLILCFVIEILMHLLAFFVVGEISSLEEWEIELYFRYNILLYLSAIGLGLWFSREHDVFNKKNRFVLILFPISVLYLVAYQFFNFRLSIDGAHLVRGDYNYLVFPYSAFIILLALKYIPKNVQKKKSKTLAAIGKSSFHIYLTQDIYFAISYALNGYPRVANVFDISVNNFVNIFYLFIDWAICISIGMLWWYAENRIRKYRLDKKNIRDSEKPLVKDKKLFWKPAKERGLIVYILKRALYSFGMVIGVIIFIFFLTRMLPGDPVMMRMPRRFTQEMYDRMKVKLGLDQPVPVQLLIYIKDVLSGNWGYSMTVVRDSLVWDVVLQRFPRTLEIMFISMPIAIFWALN